MKNLYGVDGIMVGRASIGYPWIFREIRHYLDTGTLLPGPTVEERVTVCRTHFIKSLEWKGPVVGITEMRRHYTNYFRGFDHFRDYRMKLVTSDDASEIHDILDQILERYGQAEPVTSVHK
jgi:tRNA-dihydrouridine synthase B